MTSISNTNGEYPVGQVWWFQFKSVMSYRADKTDGRKDRRGQQYSVGLEGQGVKSMNKRGRHEWNTPSFQENAFQNVVGKCQSGAPFTNMDWH